MKRNILFLTLLMFVIGFSLSYPSLKPIFAEETPSVTKMESSIWLGTGNAGYELGKYQASFNSESNPYYKHTFKLEITTSPVSYNSLSTGEQAYINSLIIWNVNDTEITFENNIFETNSYKLELEGKDLHITPKLPGDYVIKATLLTVSTSQTLCANYAVESKMSVEIQTTSNLTQNYETFDSIIFNAVLQPNSFVDNNIQYSYTWKINDIIQTEKTKTLTIDKSMIKIGTYSIEVTIAELTTLIDTETLVISTAEEYKLNVSHTGGELTQTIGQTTVLNFVASADVLTMYSVNWFIKTPNSIYYQMQNVTNNSYTFETPNYTYGTYKLFAKTTIESQTIISDIIVINLLPKQIDLGENLFEIMYIPYNNNTTQIQGYNLTIDVGSLCDDSQIVWFVSDGTSQRVMATGSKFNFKPTIAGNYIIQVKLLNADGTVSSTILSRALTLEAKPVKSYNVLIYVFAAVAALAGVCALSIVISNKKREKIW